jgi:8-hydroxy-5-deazaflavin:NADPH oxidoreductase
MDLGGIDAARGMEMYLPLWLRLYGATGTPQLNVKVVSA